MFKLFSKLSILFILINYSSIKPTLAQVSAFGNDFLNISSNAKSTALGNADIVETKSANANLYNPANIISDTSLYSFSISHQNLYGKEAILDYISGSIYSNSNALSISLLRVGIDNIQNTLNIKDSTGNFDLNKISYFSSADYALFFGFARQNNSNKFRWGLNAKLIYRNIGSFASAIGFGFNGGFAYKLNKWTVAASLQDFLGSYTFWKINQSEFSKLNIDSIIPTDFKTLEISPQKLNIGIQRKFILSENLRLSSEFNLESVFLSQENSLISNSIFSLYPKLGLEASFKKQFFIRMGFNQLQFLETLSQNKLLTQKISVGFGIKVKNIQLDYAFDNLASSNLLPSSHIFSLYIQLNQNFIPKIFGDND